MTNHAYAPMISYLDVQRHEYQADQTRSGATSLFHSEKVSEVFPGEDGIVRKVHVTYKNPKQGEPAYIYNGRGYITVERSVNRLVLLLPVDEKEQQSY